MSSVALCFCCFAVGICFSAQTPKSVPNQWIVYTYRFGITPSFIGGDFLITYGAEKPGFVRLLFEFFLGV